MMTEIDTIYLNACHDLLYKGEQVYNTLELRNFNCHLDNVYQNIISVRNLSPAYMIGEWLWYFSGSNETQFIGKYAKKWLEITDNGYTNNSAYGYRMMYEFGFNQVEKIIELLQTEPLSRRAVINLNVPNEDVIITKDEPCTIALQFMIRNDKLHCSAIMRSNDIWFGFPYDVAFFTELQIEIAHRLHIEAGSYHHFASSLHCYDAQRDKIQSILDKPISKPIRFNREKFWRSWRIVLNELKHQDEDWKLKTIELAKAWFDLEIAE